MDIRELRIGNWVLMNNKIVHMDVRLFHAVIHDFTGYSPEPIPLTSEWMVRFGFTYNDLNGDSGHWQKLPVEILEGEDGFSYDYNMLIKSVHQLQNLYFALTNQELEPSE